MLSEGEIRMQREVQHDELTRLYYQDKDAFPGGKAAFDQQHAAIWEGLETDLRAIGALPDPEPSLEDRVRALESQILGVA